MLRNTGASDNLSAEQRNACFQSQRFGGHRLAPAVEEPAVQPRREHGEHLVQQRAAPLALLRRSGASLEIRVLGIPNPSIIP